MVIWVTMGINEGDEVWAEISNMGLRGVVVLALVAVVAAKFDESLLTDELKELMGTLHSTCVDQIGIEEVDVDKIKQGVFEEHAKSKCYIKCVMSESGVMDENGNIDMTAFAEILPESLKEQYKVKLDKCVKHGDGVDDFCEKAAKIVKCIHDENPDDYFFV